MTRESIFADCEKLGLPATKAKIESGRWAGNNEIYGREWVAQKEATLKEEVGFRQEDQHEEQIETQKEATANLVGQISASSIAIGEKMDQLGDKVETLDERLSDLNTTIEKASKSSTFLGIVLAVLTIVIAIAAAIEVFQ